ncbi:hypothetical protein LIER_10317 [Lithospermum erythrorhizon]|uniref:Uncharacterized protein n=1 Tax=Lithospermum erythrorhizon TaxID=34254 RepID=A0AAV3PK89_LITER
MLTLLATENARLYKCLKQLSELISSYQSLKDTGRGAQIVTSIISTARQYNLDKDMELPGEGFEISVKEKGSCGPQTALDRPKEGISSLPSILAETVGRDIEDIYRGNDKGIIKDVELFRQITETSRGVVTAFVERTNDKRECLKLIVVDNELGSLKQALEGKYVV